MGVNHVKHRRKKWRRTYLSKCGRHCCICRRFNPLRLQVHHIKLESKGGSGDPDNLIPICITCHMDIHTDAPFVRRFSDDELKQCRERVFTLVAEGKLVGHDESHTFNPAFERDPDMPNLIPEAVKMLVDLARGQGMMLDPKGFDCRGTVHDREYATNMHAFKQLRDANLIEWNGGDAYVVTLLGYNAADGFLALGTTKNAPTTK